MNEYALSPTPLTGVMSVVAFIAVSKADLSMFFGPTATVSVPSFDVHTHPVRLNTGVGMTICVAVCASLPMTDWTSDIVTRLAMLVEVDEVETCADDALELHESALAALVPADDDGAALVAAEPAGELVDVAALDEARAEPLADGTAELEASADDDARADELANAEELATGDPNAAAEPLAPGVAPDGPHATERNRAAMAVEAMTVLFMGRRRAHHVPSELRGRLRVRYEGVISRAS